MAEVHPDTSPVQHGHETRDFNIRTVALFALSMVIVLGGSLGLIAWLFHTLHVTPEGSEPRGAPLAAAPPRPPGPRLQPSPSGDMREMLRAENAQLQSYG